MSPAAATVTGTAVAQRTKFESSVAISTFNAEEIARRAPASSADLIAAGLFVLLREEQWIWPVQFYGSRR